MKQRGFVCQLCQAEDWRLVYKVVDHITGEIFSLGSCESCGLLHTLPQLDSQQLGKYYQNYRADDGKRFWQPIEDLLNFWHLQRASKINQIKKTGRILDIGCGRGIEIARLGRLGWEAYGTEYYGVSKTELEKKGLRIFIGEVWEAGYPDKYFDLITFWHSVEHMTDIHRVLTETKRILADDGRLIVSVPNFASWERAVFGRHWFHLDVPRHTIHLSQESLIYLLDKYELQVVKVSYAGPEYDFYSFWQSGLNKIFPRDQNFLYKLLNSSQHRDAAVIFKLSQQLLVLLPLMVISLIFVPLSWLVGASGTIELTAQKKQTTRLRNQAI